MISDDLLLTRVPAVPCPVLGYKYSVEVARTVALEAQLQATEAAVAAVAQQPQKQQEEPMPTRKLLAPASACTTCPLFPVTGQTLTTNGRTQSATPNLFEELTAAEILQVTTFLRGQVCKAADPPHTRLQKARQLSSSLAFPVQSPFAASWVCAEAQPHSALRTRSDAAAGSPSTQAAAAG